MLTQEQKDLIFGSMLGDGNLQTGSDGRTWRYRAIQCADKKDYLDHKYSILQDLCGTAPTISVTTDIRRSNTSSRYNFNTLVHPCLGFYGNLFYTKQTVNGQDKWVKDVPQNVSIFLTPKAIAYWYMDDGALKWLGHSNAMRICTDSFSEGGVKLLQAALQGYNVKTTLTKKKLSNGVEGFRIAIPEASSTTFRELIRPYLLDCMKYKVSDGNRGHL